MLFLKQATLSFILENSNLQFNITNSRPVGVGQQLDLKRVSGSDIGARQQLPDGVTGGGGGGWW